MCAEKPVLTLRGGDASYPRTLPHRLEQAGLCEADGEGGLVFARGGSAAVGVHVANLARWAATWRLPDW